MKNKKIIVTGGAGYIGCHVVEELIKSGYQVTVIDRLSFDVNSLDSVEGHKNLTVIKEDLRNLNNLQSHLDGSEAVIHLAALVGEAACNISESDSISTNYDATIRLCDLARKSKVKKFIFMSTASSYGVQDTNEIANEKTKLNPVSLYAKTKIDSENDLLKNFSDDIEITIFRPSTVYGHSSRMRFDLILNHLVLDAFLKKEIKVFGPEMVRPLMWVGEPARVYKKVIESEDSKFRSEIFNMGYDNENYKKIDIAKLVQSNFFKKIDMEIIDKDKDIRSYRLDFSKMKKFFNLEPGSNLLKATRIIFDNISSKKYGDLESKKYYNT
jgi:nucleoside-diphosphate-sugar epimerase|tara:strand:- start:2451 stop:3428 length:978 start_codon:yes stop_codon:yes gene_type:complete